MSQVKFQKLINDFSPASLAEVFRSHDFFRIKENTLASFSNEQFIEFTQLGDFDLEDNTNIIVVCARSLTPLNERASRKNQYDLSKKILKNFIKARAGIFVYYDNKGDFRMSLIYADYVGTKINYSTFRRFTYFVSKDQKNITFLQQVTSLNFTNFKELKDLFSVEKVTKEFFKKYRDLFNEILEDFEKNTEFQNFVVNTGISTTPDFVKKLMGQIVFLYFVQKKGWLGVQPNKNWGEGDYVYLRTLFENCKKAGKNYFNDYLEPLFYEALAEKRGEDDFFEKLNCRVPFLNGGLFESAYDWKTTEIKIHNEVLGKLLDFFDQYNFTVDENIPSDQEISVDPEMLGKIFEELLGVKDRKDKGAFYTPREIVHYMCRESLIQHLVSDNTAHEERVRKLFEIKDTDLSLVVENEERAKNIKDVKEISEKIDFSLRNVKIIDPAVGSGAFPMGMLNEISSVRHYLNTNFLHKNNDAGKELSLYDIKKETLENCIYAVDLEPGAVEIAKLRFWLALIVEFESNDPKIAPPVLPNLDYKIMQGNSLLEEYEGIKLFDEKIIQVIDTGKEKQVEDLKKRQSLVQKEYFDLHSKNKLTAIRKVELDTEAKKIHDQLKKLNQTEKDDLEKTGLFDFDKHSESKMKAEQLKSLQKSFFETSRKDKKEDIKKQIEKIQWELIETTLREHNKVSELEKIQEFKKSRIKPFFLWKLHFADVFEQKGGFDIVIGNPPYVSVETLSETLKNQVRDKYKTFSSRVDLYCLFYEKGLMLSKKNTGLLCFITSNKWMRAGYGEKLREYFIQKNPIKLLDFGGFKVFESATVDTNILLIQNNENHNILTACHFENDYKKDDNLNEYINKNSIKLNNLNSETWFIGNSAELNLKKKIESKGVSLEKLGIKIAVGVRTGFNEAFIISKDKRNELIESDPKNIEIIKPVLRGRDIYRYGYSCKNLYIIITKLGSSKNLEKDYPSIYKHLKKYETDLKNRGQCKYSRISINKKNTENEGQHHWLELDNNPKQDFLDLFERETITWQEICSRPTFTLVPPGTIVLAANYFISGGNKFLLAFFHSKIFSFIFSRIAQSIGESHRYKPKYLNKVPIIKPSIQQEEYLEVIVNKILALTSTSDHNPKKTSIEQKKLEEEINYFLYKLYDLTPEEIEIIENSSKK